MSQLRVLLARRWTSSNKPLPGPTYHGRRPQELWPGAPRRRRDRRHGGREPAKARRFAGSFRKPLDRRILVYTQSP